MKHCLVKHCPVAEYFPAGKENRLANPGYSFTHYSHWQEVPGDFWQLAAASGDYFLQKNYLALLEDCPPSGMQFGYILFRHQGRASGIAYFQLLEFRATEHIRQEQAAPFNLKNLLATHLNFRALVCGNMLLTGQHAYYFPQEQEALSGKLLREALRKIALNIRRQGGKLDAILLKDIGQNQADSIRAWDQSPYLQLNFQPNMVLTIPESWQRMEDYLEALTSKYRVRYRRAKKKLAGIQCHELNARQINTFEQELYALYRNVAESSEFCMTYLHAGYFTELKNRAPEDFRLWAYFREERIIGFCTSLRNGNQLEAHFLGLDKTSHEEYQLYLNMLYQLIETAITSKVDQLIFSRTALAIKSSVGAVAEPTSVFLSYPFSPVLNCLTPYLIRLLEPKAEWAPRHPFKDQLAEETLNT